MSSSGFTLFDLGTMTRRQGCWMSDSSWMSLTIGSFFFCMSSATCLMTFAGDTWWGTAVMMMSPPMVR